MSTEPPQPPSALAHRRLRDGSGHRTHRVNLRLSADERDELQAAADRTGETVAGYAARIALAVARGELYEGVDVEEIRELAYELIRTRTAADRVSELLSEAVTTAHTGAPPDELLAAVTEGRAALRAVDAAMSAVVRTLSEANSHIGERRRARAP